MSRIVFTDRNIRSKFTTLISEEDSKFSYSATKSSAKPNFISKRVFIQKN